MVRGGSAARRRMLRTIPGHLAPVGPVIDQKDMYLKPVDELTHYRRFDVPKGRQLRRVVEFSHSIDSLRHPLVQLSYLVIYTTRKFMECDNGYRPNWSTEANNFFASLLNWPSVWAGVSRHRKASIAASPSRWAMAVTSPQRPK